MTQQRGVVLRRLDLFLEVISMDNRLKEIVDNFDSLKIGLDEPFRFHCTMCGKCCINREDILLTPRDMYSMAKELQISPEELFKRYCETYIGHDSCIPIVRLKPRGSIKRCPLLKDRKCSVHKAKPGVCAMFPIGRCVTVDQKAAKMTNAKIGEIQYIFTNPSCGDNAETHTVRGWLSEFGIPVEDEFFNLWHQKIFQLGSIFRKAEKVCSDHTMELAWTATFVALYLEYDTSKDFLPQFEENSEKILNLMKMIPTSKGGADRA